MSFLNLDELKGHTETWEDFLSTLVIYKGMIIIVMAVTVISAYVSLQFITELYEVQASILVKLGRENTEVRDTLQKSGVYTTGVREEDINSEIQLLRSRGLIRHVIDEIGLDVLLAKGPEPEGIFQSLKYYLKKVVGWGKQQAINVLIALNLKKEISDKDKLTKGLQKVIGIDRAKRSDVINISLRSPDPGLAVLILNKYLERYLERHIEVRRNPDIRSFFDSQAEEYRNRLSVIEENRESLKGDLRVSSIKDERGIILKRQHKLYGEIQNLKNEIRLLNIREGEKSKQAGKDDVDKDLAGPKNSTVSSIETIKKRITGLRLDRVKLIRSYKAESKPIINLDNEIASLEQLLLRTLNTKINRLKVNVSKLSNKLNTLNHADEELSAIDREHKVAEESYIIYEKRREEARISDEMDLRRVANITILEKPHVPAEPVYPRKLLIMGISIPLGLLLGIGMALLMEYFGNLVRKPGDITSIDGLNYLGTFHLTKEKV